MKHRSNRHIAGAGDQSGVEGFLHSSEKVTLSNCPLQQKNDNWTEQSRKYTTAWKSNNSAALVCTILDFWDWNLAIRASSLQLMALIAYSQANTLQDSFCSH